MIPRLKVLFLGNHTVGVRTLRALRRVSDVAGVVAHPDDPEDGVRYESVFAEAHRLGVPAIRAEGRSDRAGNFARACAPDLLWVTDYRYLLPAAVVGLAPRGAVNLHPSLLPRYRGRASINWAIIRGETELGLSAHWIDAGMDTGNILAQRRYTLGPDEDVGDALAKLYPLYEAITADVMAQIARGPVAGTPQDHAAATEFPRRRPEDGAIDWDRPAQEIRNLIRAVAAPYPGAFGAVRGARLRIWQAGSVRAFAPGTRPLPGESLEIAADFSRLTVACADAALEITRFEIEAGVLEPPAVASLPPGGPAP